MRKQMPSCIRFIDTPAENSGTTESEKPEVTEATAAPATPATTDEQVDWKVEAEEWRKHSRDWEQKAKANKQAADENTKLKEQQAQLETQLAEFKAKAEQYEQQAQIASIKDTVSKESGVPAKYLSGSNEDEIKASAELLKELVNPTPTLPNQGKTPDKPATDPNRTYVRQLFNH